MLALETPGLIADALWQTTLLLGLGLLAAHCARKRPARAHALLSASLIAALAAPLVSHVVRTMGWGFLAADVELTLEGTPPTALNAAIARDATGLTLNEWLGWAWALCAGVLLLRLAWQISQARSYLRAARRVRSTRLQAQLDQASARLGLAARPVLFSSPRLKTPVIWSWTRQPRIYLPAHCIDAGEWRAVLCHELAHFKRRDHLAVLLTEVAACCLMFQPLFWLARRALALHREHASDAWVLACGERPAEYAESLLRLQCGAQPQLVLAATRHGLVARVATILGGEHHSPRIGATWRAVLAAVTVAATLNLALAQPGAPLLLALAAKDDLPRAEPTALEGMPAEWRSQIAFKPGLQVVPAELDLGEVAPGANATGSLWIINNETEPVHLLGAQPTCGCVTLASLRNIDIAPGQAVELPLSMQAPASAQTSKTQHVLIAFAGQQPLKIPVHIRAGGAPE